MDHFSVVLTPADRTILESYKTMAEGLSDYLGSGYEIVLHSLEDMDRSVIKILNGYHTGRREGAPITDLALDMLSKIRQSGAAPYVSYFTQNKKGEPLRSSTIAILGEHGRVIGLMCMNLYLNTPMADILSTLTPHHLHLPTDVSETFSDTSRDMIESTVRQVQTQVQADASICASLKNRAIVSLLYEKGIFNLKDAVIRTAELLDISKNTVYLHLRNLAGHQK